MLNSNEVFEIESEPVNYRYSLRVKCVNSNENNVKISFEASNVLGEIQHEIICDLVQDIKSNSNQKLYSQNKNSSEDVSKISGISNDLSSSSSAS